jgi:methionyl-tRNA formyltransferase
MKPAPSAVKRLAIESGLEVFQPATLKDPAALARIAEARPEALVVAAYGLVLPQSVLVVAPHGALNIHASLLPRWRGAAPIQRALLAGDPETGISIVRMDAGLDTGPVLARRSLAIARDDDAGTLHDKLAALGAELIVATLADLAGGRARAEPQPEIGATYAAKLGKDEAILDWTRSAAELERQVRAFCPAPGAVTSLRGEPLKVFRARLAAGSGKPGTVLAAGAPGLRVACGEGALELTELQRAGGRRLDAAALLRGLAVAPGERLGRAL